MRETKTMSKANILNVRLYWKKKRKHFFVLIFIGLPSAFTILKNLCRLKKDENSGFLGISLVIFFFL